MLSKTFSVEILVLMRLLRDSVPRNDNQDLFMSKADMSNFKDLPLI